MLRLTAKVKVKAKVKGTKTVLRYGGFPARLRLRLRKNQCWGAAVLQSNKGEILNPKH